MLARIKRQQNVLLIQSGECGKSLEGRYLLLIQKIPVCSVAVDDPCIRKLAGKFLAYLVDKDVEGAINGSSLGTISLREIINYVEEKTGAKAVLDSDGDNAPYNGDPEFSINTDKAKSLGFEFTDIHEWIYELIDYYIEDK
mgnify:CR=1 FL=1